MSDFTKYKRSAVAELRPYVPGEDMAAINVSTEDAAAGSPKEGDMIARNPANNADQWLINAAYFAANFSAMTTTNGHGAPASTTAAPLTRERVIEMLNNFANGTYQALSPEVAGKAANFLQQLALSGEKTVEGGAQGLTVAVNIGDFFAHIPVSQMARDKVLMAFNVTGDARTTALKALSAAQIQIMLNHQDETKKEPDQTIRNARMRAASIAITQVELTQMPLVKALFAKA